MTSRLSCLAPTLRFALTIAATLLPRSAAASDTSPAEELRKVVEACFERELELNPFRATQLGDHRFDDRFPDGLSDDYRKAVRTVASDCMADVRAVDRSALDDDDRLTYDLFLRSGEETLAQLKLPEHLLPVDHTAWSIPLTLARLASGASVQPFRDADDYTRFIQRMRGFADWTDVAIARMNQGVEVGVVLPRRIAELTLRQLDGLLESKWTEGLLAGALETMPSGVAKQDRKRISAAWKQVVESIVLPAYRKLRDYIRDDYIEHTRTTISLSALPAGRSWYAHRVRAVTTTDLEPDAIYALGVGEVDRIVAELRVLAKELGHDNLVGLYDSFHGRDRWLKGERPVLAEYRRIGKRVRQRLPELFTRRDDLASLSIRAVGPELRGAAAGAFYEPPTSDGSRPGVFFVNVGTTYHEPLMESLYLHEGEPGHHLQHAVAASLDNLPRFRRFAHFGAYVEGWALYAESLGDQLGLYEDPWQRMGRLHHELLRAARLVLDVGIHHRGWSADDARAIAQERLLGYGAHEIDRYTVMPGQALGYKIGELRILELRRRARDQLGDRFDLRGFHDVILTAGALPLDLLETRVDRWLARHSTPRQPNPRSTEQGP